MGFDPFMKVAFELAKKAHAADIRPNPFVGAVVVSPEDEIIGRGFHKKYGEPHAEVYAINEALSNRTDLSDCTLYVTLEPCSHFGNTPPCTDLIIKHRLKKVVIGSKDFDKRVNGIEILRKANIDTIIQFHDEITNLNRVFNTNKEKNRSFIALKMATSFDGKIKDSLGNSKWISGKASRDFVHENLRMSADAILTTAKTVIEDDASFNIRLSEDNILDKDVFVLDRNFSLLEDQYKQLKLFSCHPNSSIFLIGDLNFGNVTSQNVKLIQAEYIENQLIDLQKLFETLLVRGYYSILVEAGSYLATKLLETDLIDELNLFIAPFALASTSAQSFLESTAPSNIYQTQNFKIKEILKFEDDVMISYTRC